MLDKAIESYLDDKKYFAALYLAGAVQTPILTISSEKSEFHTSAFYATQIIACRFPTHQSKINPWHIRCY